MAVSAMWAVTAENCFGWAMFALITGIIWNMIGYPFRRWAP